MIDKQPRKSVVNNTPNKTPKMSQTIVIQTRKSVKNNTPFETPKKKQKLNEEFEVDELLEHRGRKPNRKFLVRWKNFSPKHNSWESEKNLKSCSKILKEYLKKHRLQER